MVGLFKVILHKPSLGLHRSRRETRVSSCSELCCVCPLARVHQTSRAYRAKMLAQNAGAPKTRSAHGCCSAQRVRRHVTAREAGGGVQLACGRCHRPAEPSRLRSAARVGWRRRAPRRSRTSFVLALGAKQPAPNTVPRRYAPAARYGPSGRCASRRRPAEVSGRENPVLTRGVCLLTQASLGPDLV